MRRLLLLVAAAALAVATPASGEDPAPEAPAPTRVQVLAKEFSFQLSRAKVKKGKAIIELANFGQDPHDLQVQKSSGGAIVTTGVVAPNTRREVTLKLASGRYKLWCSLADHQARGMNAVLVVKSG